MPKQSPQHPFEIDTGAWRELQEAAASLTYDLTDEKVYQLRLRLHTPGIFALYKADIPAPGLPMLDGFLKFLVFRYLWEQLNQRGTLDGYELLWQANAALHDAALWIDFPIPIREEQVNEEVALYDCSVGLPVTPEEQTLYPAASFFVCEGDLVTYPSEETGAADYIDLRRRSVEPYYRPFTLRDKLNTSSGSNKALDNRIYYALTREYVFYLRGDTQALTRLLDFAQHQQLGIGKKTTLGYGRLASHDLTPMTTREATLAEVVKLQGLEYLTLLKNFPQAELQRRAIREDNPPEPAQNQRLFGVESFVLASPIATYDRYRPPYWRREGRAPVFRYGSLLLERRR
jgi:hypothetical protein